MAIALITNYTTLQAAIVEELNRTGDSAITAYAPNLIQLAEAAIKRDERLRRRTIDTLSFTSGTETAGLPADYVSTEVVTHNGPTYYGKVDTVDFDRLEEIRLLHGTTGFPRAIALDPVNLLAYAAPTPDDSYDLRIVYIASITSIATAGTNWLLTAHPDVYFYGALIHSAPYVKEPELLAMWASLYNTAVESVSTFATRQTFSGRMTRKRRPIGG